MAFYLKSSYISQVGTYTAVVKATTISTVSLTHSSQPF